MSVGVVYQQAFGSSKAGGEKRLFEIHRGRSSVVWYVQSPCGYEYLDSIKIEALSVRGMSCRSVYGVLCWCLLMLRIPFDRHEYLHVGLMPFFHIPFLLVRKYARRVLGKKSPVIVVDFWEFWGATWFRKNKIYGFLGFIVEKFIIRFSDKLVVISESGLSSLSCVRHKVFFIPNGVNSQCVPLRKTSDREFDFAYIGRLEKHKRVDLVVQVFQYLAEIEPTLRFLIAGTGSDSNRIDEQIAKAQRCDITRLGKITSDEDVMALFGDAKAFLFFGTQEGGSSIACLEAYASGCLVFHVEAKNGVERNFLFEPDTFFVPEGRADMLARYVYEVMGDITDRSAEVREFVSEKAWPVISDSYYRSVFYD